MSWDLVIFLLFALTGTFFVMFIYEYTRIRRKALERGEWDEVKQAIRRGLF